MLTFEMAIKQVILLILQLSVLLILYHDLKFSATLFSILLNILYFILVVKTCEILWFFCFLRSQTWWPFNLRSYVERWLNDLSIWLCTLDYQRCVWFSLL